MELWAFLRGCPNSKNNNKMSSDIGSVLDPKTETARRVFCYVYCVIACIICCRVNVTLDMILGVEDILISWFVIILALLGIALLFVCCMIHC